MEQLNKLRNEVYRPLMEDIEPELSSLATKISAMHNIRPTPLKLQKTMPTTSLMSTCGALVFIL